MPQVLDFHGYSDPPDFTWNGFVHAVYEACKAAWDDGRREIESVTLPEGAFPAIGELQNPITRSLIPVKRLPLVKVASKTVYVSAPDGLTPNQIRELQNSLREVVGDHIIVIPPGSKWGD